MVSLHCLLSLLAAAVHLLFLLLLDVLNLQHRQLADCVWLQTLTDFAYNISNGIQILQQLPHNKGQHKTGKEL